MLAHWGWAVAGGRGDSQPQVVRVAAALELLHLFALIQDDVMDRSASRRGRPTLHVVAAERHREQAGLGDAALFGDSVATLVSDLALSEATMLVAGTAPEVRAAWRLMAVELVEGQLLDVTHTAGRRRDLPTSRRIARFKSGRYTITRPLEFGALVAGAEAGLVRRLVTWGDLVGDAFAVRDDVLGVWGDPARTGKPAGDDLRSASPPHCSPGPGSCCPTTPARCSPPATPAPSTTPGSTRCSRRWSTPACASAPECAVADLVARAHHALDDLDVDPEADAALRDLADAIAWRSA